MSLVKKTQSAIGKVIINVAIILIAVTKLFAYLAKDLSIYLKNLFNKKYRRRVTSPSVVLEDGE